jgi:MOSC domain-containing protein
VKTVSRLSIAPVKGMALVHPEEIALESFGVSANRRFFVVDEDGRRYGQIRDGTLVRIQPEYDETTGALTLRFPDDSVVDGVPQLAETIVTDFYGRPVRGRVVEGAWSEAISRFAGRPLRLVRCDEPGAGVDRGLGTVTMLSDASLDALAKQAEVDGVDGRRFRMLIGIAGCEPHEEDAWLGGLVRVGEAVVRLHEQVARCAITTQNPDSGAPDFDTLREIKQYRGMRGKEVDFGVFGEVETSGRVRVGDAVEPLP